jgi:integrase/recombinase XerD
MRRLAPQNLSSKQSAGGPLARAETSAAANLIEHFLLQFASLNTRRNYAADLESFFSFWREKGIQLETAIHEVNDKQIFVWLEQFHEPSTRARKLASLSSFFRFCEERRFIAVNPCRVVKRPQVSRTQATQALTEDETLRLLDTLKSRAESVFEGSHAQRQQHAAQLSFAVLHTLFSVGMRVDELCELRISDLLFHPPQFKMRFISKGGDEHVVAISQASAEVIQSYLNNCRGTVSPADFVFARAQSCSRKVKLSQTAIFRMIRDAAAAAGIQKTISPHSARATVATVLHRQGVPLGFIQSLLNHKQITTTAHYVKKANERSESAALKAPVKKWLSESE